MTHDELLALIDKEVFTIVSVNDPSDIEIARLRRLKVALRAVVKYHKPCDNGATLLDYNGPIFGNCEGCRRAGVRVKWESCHTIILIQKELG